MIATLASKGKSVLCSSVCPRIAFLSFRAIRCTAAFRSSNSCWKCGRTDVSQNGVVRFCNACRTLQPFAAHSSYFELFSENKSFNLNNSVLNRKFKEMQRILHPDKFATATEKERELSADYSSFVNEAYKVLVDPYHRGQYLLRLYGKELKEGESDINLTPDFLMEMMEFNEAIASDNISQDALKTLKIENEAKIEEVIKEISTAFEFTDFDSAKLLLAKLKFYNNAAEKIKEKLQ